MPRGGVDYSYVSTPIIAVGNDNGVITYKVIDQKWRTVMSPLFLDDNWVPYRVITDEEDPYPNASLSKKDREVLSDWWEYIHRQHN